MGKQRHVLGGCSLPALMLVSALCSTSEAGSGQAVGDAFLILADREGLHMLDREGRPLRTVTKTPASWPRYLPGRKEILFLHEGKDASLQLRRIELASGREELFARLPTFRSGQFYSRPDSDSAQRVERLSVRSVGDFQLGPQAACLHMRDRNHNMASVDADLRVDLATRSVQVLRLGCVGSECRPEIPYIGYLSAPCPTGGSEVGAVLRQMKEPPYFVRNERLQLRMPNGKDKTLALLQDGSDWGWMQLGITTRSLRWTTLQGNIDNGSDSLLRQVLLLDRQTGKIYPIPSSVNPSRGQSQPWPAALTKAKLAQVGDRTKLSTLEVGEDSTFTALGAEEKLIVENLLLIPGRAVVYLGGDIAF